MPAVGFAAGDVVLGELLKDKGLQVSQPPRSSVFVVGFENAWPERVIKRTREIRDAGISAEFPLKPAAVGKQMALANAARARMVVFAGGEEEKAGKIKIKNMNTGEERVIPSIELITSLKTMLG